MQYYTRESELIEGSLDTYIAIGLEICSESSIETKIALCVDYVVLATGLDYKDNWYDIYEAVIEYLRKESLDT